MTVLRLLPIAPGAAAARALPVLADALAGAYAVLPHAAGHPPPAVDPTAVPDPGTALVVGTSGSTGTPKLAMLPATALRSSAAATHERLGGPGQWLLTMPPHHVAGVQVLLRSLAAGTVPVCAEVTDGFTTRAFCAGTDAMAAGRRYTAVVPTQLRRLLDDPDGTRALASYDGVLVGGAASDPRLLRRAHDAGVAAVTTYGMSETAGGCVYDGVPLRSCLVRTDDVGRLHLGGAVLATGYLGRPDLTAQAFSAGPDGTRWFRTDDAGHRDDAGRWHVDGRLDDLVTTGGLKVAPRLVEEALTGLPDIVEAVVVGSPDQEWGQAVSAAVVLAPGTPEPTVEDLRERLRSALPSHALPRRVVVVGALPLRGPGKPDRARVAALF